MKTLGKIAQRFPIWFRYFFGYACIEVIEPLRWGFIQSKRFERFLAEAQWWSLDVFQHYQNRQLQILITHAYYNVPYYHKLFIDYGLKPYDIKTRKDLSKLPILTKEKIVENFDTLIARNIPPKEMQKRASIRSTSGSTGTPMRFYLDRNLFYRKKAHFRWMLSVLGCHEYDKHVSFWSRPFIDNKAVNRTVLHQPYERKLSLSSIETKSDTLKNYLTVIKNFKPKFVMGAPSFVYTLACYARDHGIKNVTFPIFLSAFENLYSFQKELIAQYFQCEIFQMYNSGENVINAIECPSHIGMHLNMLQSVTEIVNDEGNCVSEGNKGRIISTAFNNFIMPFLRYDLGDIGALSTQQCACGRRLPVFKSFDGRVSEVLIFNDKKITPAVLSVAIQSCLHIQECQFIQEGDNALIINLVKRDRYSQADEKKLLTVVRDIIGLNIQTHINYVPFIKRTRMGKFQFVIKR